MAQKSILTSVDIASLINAMKRVFMTKDEFNTQVGFIVRERLDKALDEKLEQKFDEKLRLLPTKDQFFTRMDKLSGEIQKVRDEQTLHQGQHDRLDRRVSRVEKKLNLTSLVD